MLPVAIPYRDPTLKYLAQRVQVLLLYHQILPVITPQLEKFVSINTMIAEIFSPISGVRISDRRRY